MNAPMGPVKSIGERAPLGDGPEKVTGRGKYAAEYRRPRRPLGRLPRTRLRPAHRSPHAAGHLGRPQQLRLRPEAAAGVHVPFGRTEAGGSGARHQAGQTDKPRLTGLIPRLAGR